MNAKERMERNDKVLEMFVRGATYRQIAAQGFSGCATPGAAHKIVEKGLREAAQRRALLSDEAFGIHQERQERLLAAHFGRALGRAGVDPDHRSAELVRRILAQQARLYGLEADPAPLPAPTGKLTGSEQDDEEEQDDLARLRARRSPSAG